MSTTEGEKPTVLEDTAEVLLRQVHPTQFNGGELSSSAFMPTERDKGMMSTLRGYVGPEEAHRRWTEDFGRKSVGTYGISVGEVQNEDLRALDDASSDLPDHASVDFTAVITSKGKLRQIGRKLKERAVDRGCLYAS